MRTPPHISLVPFIPLFSKSYAIDGKYCYDKVSKAYSRTHRSEAEQ